jgi:hypothetical protein
VRTGRLLRQIDSICGFERIALTPDGRSLIALRGDRSIHVWDWGSGKPVRLIRDGSTDVRSVLDLALSPEGRLVACCGDEVEIRDLQVVRSFPLPTSWTSCLAFSPNGRTLLSGHGDGTILLWEVSGSPRSDKQRAHPAQFTAWWKDLAHARAERAYRALWSLAAHPQPAVPLARKHLRAVARPSRERITRLIADLDADTFAVREKATERLRRLGRLAEPALRNALAVRPSAEQRRRIGHLLARLERLELSSAERQALRAVELLELIGTPEARAVLADLAAGAPQAWLTREARSSLKRLANLPRKRSALRGP